MNNPDNLNFIPESEIYHLEEQTHLETVAGNLKASLALTRMPVVSHKKNISPDESSRLLLSNLGVRSVFAIRYVEEHITDIMREIDQSGGKKDYESIQTISIIISNAEYQKLLDHYTFELSLRNPMINREISVSVDGKIYDLATSPVLLNLLFTQPPNKLKRAVYDHEPINPPFTRTDGKVNKRYRLQDSIHLSLLQDFATQVLERLPLESKHSSGARKFVQAICKANNINHQEFIARSVFSRSIEGFMNLQSWYQSMVNNNDSWNLDVAQYYAEFYSNHTNHISNANYLNQLFTDTSQLDPVELETVFNSLFDSYTSSNKSRNTHIGHLADMVNSGYLISFDAHKNSLLIKLNNTVVGDKFIDFTIYKHENSISIQPNVLDLSNINHGTLLSLLEIANQILEQQNIDVENSPRFNDGQIIQPIQDGNSSQKGTELKEPIIPNKWIKSRLKTGELTQPNEVDNRNQTPKVILIPTTLYKKFDIKKLPQAVITQLELLEMGELELFNLTTKNPEKFKGIKGYVIMTIELAANHRAIAITKGNITIIVSVTNHTIYDKILGKTKPAYLERIADHLFDSIPPDPTP